MKLFSLRRISSFVIICLLFFIGVQLFNLNRKLSLMVRHPSRFSVEQITTEFPYNPDWTVNYPQELTQFVNMVTQQPFSYLGKGCQAIAFGSEDGEYVLKFFYQGRFKEVPFLNKPFDHLFNAEFRKQMEERQAHRQEIFL